MTTTVCLDARTKKRLAEAAKRAGGSPHAVMVDAITSPLDHVEEAERHRAIARARLARMERTGEVVGLGDMKRWLRARAHGKPAPAPTVVKRSR
ncbi:MAG: hypothetical protein MUC96_25375 [Myxococcaceae bacterium]|jgi:predicted transcriptional regulator|nr:hypothetical protein [Myxococcaceae bacterium]